MTSGGEETLATPACQGWLARVPLPLGAAVNKIKGATLTPPNTQARALRVCIPSSRNRGSIGIGLRSPTSFLVLVLNNCRLCSLRGGEPKAPLPCQVQVHRLIPPKRLNRRTPFPHRSRTKFPDWSIYDEICHSLSTYAHIMGNHLQTGFFQHIHQARVQP